MSVQAAFFYAFAALAVFGGVAMIGFVRSVASGALALVVTMVSLSGIFVLLDAHFLAAVQLLIYAGAILVLFLLVILSLDLREERFGWPSPLRMALKFGGVAVVLLLAWRSAGLAQHSPPSVLRAPGELPAGFGGFAEVGRVLFANYAVPVELVALLLLVGMVGAVILASPEES